MLLYSTEFPIISEASVEDVIRHACEWIKASPHSKILKVQECQPPAKGEHTITTAAETLSTGLAEGKGYTIGGIKYTRIEHNNLEWTTTVVSKRSSLKHTISIQIQCVALESTIKLPQAKKPLIIEKLLTTLGGGMDGEVPITDKPFRLSDGDEEIAALLINGVAGNLLPVIYVSHGGNASFIHPQTLAKLASGIAHVILEPSAHFSFNLKHLVSSRNVYNGAIGVYWPDNNTRYVYIPNPSKTQDCIQQEIIDKIRTTLVSKRLSADCTWLHLQDVIARNNYQKLKHAGETELSEWYELYKSEIHTKNELINQAESEIARLRTEIKIANAQLQEHGTVPTTGAEQDFYEYEIRDMIVQALLSCINNTTPDSRKRHIIQDIISSNPIQGHAKLKAEEVKRLFKSYSSMDAKTRSLLDDLGFTISDEGKHYKLTYRNDPRYTFALAKTGSDHRGGKNMASDINKQLFR